MPTPREAYTNSVEQQGFSGARVRPADFGSAGETIGRAVQGFGQAMGQAAETYQKIQEEDAKVAAQEADNIRQARRLKRYYGDPENNIPGFFNQEGKNAVLDAQALATDLDKIDKEVAAELKLRGRALSLFNEVTTKRNTDDMPRVSQHVFKERTKYEDQVDSDAFDLAIDTASTADDPAIIEENIATAGNIAVRTAMRKGLTDGNSLANARQAGVGKAVAAIASKMELKSPSEAQAFVTVHAKDMDPQEAGELLKHLAPNAAKERAGEAVNEFLVTTSITEQTAPTDALGVTEGQIVPTLPPDEAALEAAQITQESGGRHIVGGQLIKSSAGARGITQVMPKTGVDPGYGVKPLQNSSKEEYIRFRRDYMNALRKEYKGNIVLALTAYNWGPGNVDAHIKRVGDPSKGQISDASFLNSIPVKEAREYADLILNRTGVSVSGKQTTSTADPAKQAPTYQGEEVNLAATYAKIDASDRTFMEKEALKSEASRIHSLGRQAKAEAEGRLKDAVATVINDIGPENFTSYDKLPLTVRQQLSNNPTLEASYRQQAHTNEQNRRARIEAQNNEIKIQKSREAELNVQDIQLHKPDEFLRIDFRTEYPELTHEDRIKYRNQQGAERKSRQGGSNVLPAGSVREAIGRFVGKGKQYANFNRERTGAAYQKALELAQAKFDANGGKITPAEIDGIALSVMMPTTVAGGATRPRFEGGGRVNIRDEARRILMLENKGYPTEAAIDREVARMRDLGYINE